MPCNKFGLAIAHEQADIARMIYRTIYLKLLVVGSRNPPKVVARTFSGWAAHPAPGEPQWGENGWRSSSVTNWRCRGGGPEALRRHLNFRQISHRFTSSFTNPSFQDLNGSHFIYWNMMILNRSRFKVEPHSKFWYFCIERVDLLSLRFSENTPCYFTFNGRAEKPREM